jgi:hypothetical protein
MAMLRISSTLEAPRLNHEVCLEKVLSALNFIADVSEDVDAL